MLIKNIHRLFCIFSLLLTSSLVWAEQPTLDPAMLAIWQQERADILETNKHSLENLIRNAEKIVGIELIIAGPINDQFESRFGHTLLRFVQSGNTPINDLVVSFVADVDEPLISYKKGVLGGYKIIPLTKTLGAFIQAYLEKEERPLARYIIPTTKEHRKALILKLEGWLKGQEAFPEYRFFTDNCAGVVLQFLRGAGIPAYLNAPVPSALPMQLNYQYLSPYPAFVSRTSTKLLKDISVKLNTPMEDLRKGAFPQSILPLLNRLSKEELAQLYYKSPPLDTVVAKAMRETILRQGPVKLENVYGVPSIAANAYQLCDSAPCAHAVLKALSDSNVNIERKRLDKLARDYINMYNPIGTAALRKFVQHSLLISEALP